MGSLVPRACSPLCLFNVYKKNSQRGPPPRRSALALRGRVIILGHRLSARTHRPRSSSSSSSTATLLHHCEGRCDNSISRRACDADSELAAASHRRTMARCSASPSQVLASPLSLSPIEGRNSNGHSYACHIIRPFSPFHPFPSFSYHMQPAPHVTGQVLIHPPPPPPIPHLGEPSQACMCVWRRRKSLPHGGGALGRLPGQQVCYNSVQSPSSTLLLVLVIPPPQPARLGRA